MYSSIMIPVDLQHADKLDKALATAADLGNHYKAAVHVVGVTAATPGPIAHNPEEFAAKLGEFAAQQSSTHGVEFKPKAMTSHDPTIDLEATLQKAAEEVGADLVVMASHVPGIMEHLMASHAGYLASHTKLSMFIVR